MSPKALLVQTPTHRHSQQPIEASLPYRSLPMTKSNLKMRQNLGAKLRRRSKGTIQESRAPLATTTFCCFVRDLCSKSANHSGMPARNMNLETSKMSLQQQKSLTRREQQKITSLCRRDLVVSLISILADDCVSARSSALPRAAQIHCAQDPRGSMTTLTAPTSF